MFLHSCDLLEGTFGLEALQGGKKISKLIKKLVECIHPGLASCQLLPWRIASTRIVLLKLKAKGQAGSLYDYC